MFSATQDIIKKYEDNCSNCLNRLTLLRMQEDMHLSYFTTLKMRKYSNRTSEMSECVRLRLGIDRNPNLSTRSQAPTFGLVFLGAAAGLLRLWIYEIVIRMRTNVLSHSQVTAVNLVCVHAIAQRDHRQKDEPAKKLRRMGHTVSFYSTLPVTSITSANRGRRMTHLHLRVSKHTSHKLRSEISPRCFCISLYPYLTLGEQQG